MISSLSGQPIGSSSVSDTTSYQRSVIQRDYMKHVDSQLASAEPVDEIEIASMLDGIRNGLRTRFAPSLRTMGYFEEYLSIAPRLASRADELVEEQGLLLAEISYIADEALMLLHPYEEASRKGLLALRRHFGNFLRRWQSYEDRETDLICDALYEDIGTGD